MKLLTLLLLPFISSAQCQSPTLLQTGSSITVIDNFNSGLYEFFFINPNQDTSSIANDTPDPAILSNLKSGAKLWLNKFCTPYPNSSTDGFEFIKLFYLHKHDNNWVTSNTITVK